MTPKGKLVRKEIREETVTQELSTRWVFRSNRWEIWDRGTWPPYLIFDTLFRIMYANHNA